MIGFPAVPLPGPTAAALAVLQNTVIAQPSYELRVAEGKTLFKKRNTKTDAVFMIVRQKLSELSGVTRRCAYCEDSLSDEVEHVAPKDLYPDQVFIWENYVYSCGPCNGTHKRSRWKIFTVAGGAATDVTRKPKAPVIPPIAGVPLFINPRVENPMDFLQLDLAGGTAFYLVRRGLTVSQANRAEYTRSILGLNTRPGLADGRKHAFTYLRDTLSRYDLAKSNGETPASPDQQRRIDAIKNTGYRTVWLEMQRQKAALGLSDIFVHNPEANTW